MADKYEKEDYVHQYSLEWWKGHICSLTFKENKDLMKGKILDLGCNAGTTSCILSQYCDEVIGLDINKKALEKAEGLIKKEGIKNVNFVHANIINMPFENDCFDGIYALQILEHIYPEDMDKVLEEIKRVLKPGGLVIAEFPTQTCNYYNAPQHVFFFENKEKIKEVFNKFFKIEKIYHETRANPARPTEIHDDWRVFLKKWN